MHFYADLHIHSCYSRATSKDLSPKTLDGWARIKGLDVIGTGDFTHPKWRSLLHEQLERDDATGLYTLKGEPSYPSGLASAPAFHRRPRFLLQTEISSIYKKNGRVRKIHTLLYVPSLEDADRFSNRLEKIGNLHSDGRPILGIDAKDLLSLLLETVPDAILIPAHIWTPWFSLFGSRSGFDSIEECFEDLSDEIFALETGLSSDPIMNRYVSALDRFVLVSNSDAHSGQKLAREANVFEGSPSFSGIFTALKKASERVDKQEILPCSFKGTVEFFPEEGKYHLDGHRACNIVLNPVETEKCHKNCPVCNKPLTVGVLHRVMDLADRKQVPSLPFEPPFRSIVPLQEIIAELLGMGAGSASVSREYTEAITTLGPELEILLEKPIDMLSAYWPELGLACERLRTGKVLLEGGYDGEFGHVHLFTDTELSSFPSHKESRKKKERTPKTSLSKDNLLQLEAFQRLKPKIHAEPSSSPVFSDEQNAAIGNSLDPTLVLAGPGAGKTHLLTGRVQWLLKHGYTRILALTFTQKAANEMQKRIAFLDPDGHVRCRTLHAFCYEELEKNEINPLILNDDAALVLFREANPELSARESKNLLALCTTLREKMILREHSGALRLHMAYDSQKKIRSGIFDFVDILEEAMALFKKKPPSFDAVLVDEVQDCSALNIAVISTLLPKDGRGFFAIGDPDQSIYGFRGALDNVEETLKGRYPKLTLHKLSQSFRASQSILSTAQSVLHAPKCGMLHAARDLHAELTLCRAPDEHAEALWIAKKIQTLLGLSSHTLQDAKKNKNIFAAALAPQDIAILVRFSFLMPPIAKALKSAGIPYSCPNAQSFWNDPCIHRFLQALDPAMPQHKISVSDTTRPQELLPWLEAQPWSGYQPGKSPAFKLLCQMWDNHRSWQVFFAELAWEQSEERLRMKGDSVSLITIHAAKGLEFRAVFLPALENGILPASEALFGVKKGEEERKDSKEKQASTEKPVKFSSRLMEEQRLCYVGITRASELLFASYADGRSIFGQRRELGPSPFIPSIEPFCRLTSVRKKKVKIVDQEPLFTSNAWKS
ncbi:MAG: UvrD-helicase domain-containing protein [Desulfovibrio sp.]|nr:UvrD-helicase domain-containing protein [Desulfovibrio sp.]